MKDTDWGSLFHEKKKKQGSSEVGRSSQKTIAPNHLSSLIQNCTPELIAKDITEAKKHYGQNCGWNSNKQQVQNQTDWYELKSLLSRTWYPF